MKFKKMIAAATVCTCLLGTLSIPTSVKAEEATTSTLANETATTQAGRTVPHYDITQIGGTWDGTHYYLSDGTLATQCFFTDGKYTYYLQNDGTPMTNRLTYHPDGEHLIYFDNNGHELFDQFQFCQDVQYTCYFNTFGYAYFDQTTYANNKAYYLDKTGKMQQNAWFQYGNGVDYGYATADGSLMNNGFGYDPWGRVVYYNWNGTVARTTISDGTYRYKMDSTDGHLVSQTMSMIGSVDSKSTIEADVVLSGAGSGYHAKLVICTGTSAVSFGLQYDAHAVAPYTGKTMALIENIGSNGAGGQSYVRPGNKEVAQGTSYHLMMTMNNDGSGSVYLNGEMIGTYQNPSMANQDLTLRVEASGRQDGDSVNATFKNVQLKYNGTYIDRVYTPHEFKTNPTLNTTVNNWDDISFTGSVSGLGGGYNWDNKYDQVSDIIQYVP